MPGTLSIGNGGTTGSLVGNVTNNAAMQFNRTCSGVPMADHPGTGTLTKLSSGHALAPDGGEHVHGRDDDQRRRSRPRRRGDDGEHCREHHQQRRPSGQPVERTRRRPDRVRHGQRGEAWGRDTDRVRGERQPSTHRGDDDRRRDPAGRQRIGLRVPGGDVTNNGTLVFVKSGATTFSGVVWGRHGQQQSGTGLVTLTGASTYTGGTTVTGTGGLQIGNGGATGSVVGNITNDTALTFNRSDASTYAGDVSGTGTVTKLAART